jgi:short subunit dehydrogenase-like uncharacterized protein
MTSDFLLYGATGYTGGLIIERAVAAGLRPLLAGRNPAKLRTLASEHALEQRAFSLDDTAGLDSALSGVSAVLHAAGPFAHTAAPMMEACIRTRTHYVDITGEIEVFERLHRESDRARDAGIMVLPGAGFDVVPTDLLAAHLKRRLPGATQLRLAFYARGGSMSRGTLTTMVENVGRGGAVRIDGRITRVPPAWRTRVVDFGFGTRPVSVTTIPWGDVSTAYHSTGIPNVEVYAHAGSAQRRMLEATRVLKKPLGWPPVQRVLKSWIRARVAGPDAEQRRHAASFVHGEAWDDAGVRVESRMRTPEGYALTAMTSVEVIRRVLAGAVKAGFQTPSLAYGADWVLELDGVEREDVV